MSEKSSAKAKGFDGTPSSFIPKTKTEQGLLGAASNETNRRKVGQFNKDWKKVLDALDSISTDGMTKQNPLDSWENFVEALDLALVRGEDLPLTEEILAQDPDLCKENTHTIIDRSLYKACSRLVLVYPEVKRILDGSNRSGIVCIHELDAHFRRTNVEAVIDKFASFVDLMQTTWKSKKFDSISRQIVSQSILMKQYMDMTIGDLFKLLVLKVLVSNPETSTITRVGWDVIVHDLSAHSLSQLIQMVEDGEEKEKLNKKSSKHFTQKAMTASSKNNNKKKQKGKKQWSKKNSPTESQNSNEVKTKESSHKYSFSKSENSEVESFEGILDSGSSSHIVQNKNWLTEFRELNESFDTAHGGKTLKILGEGNLTILVKDIVGRWRPITLTNVKWSPNAASTLVSLMQLKKAGCWLQPNQEKYELVMKGEGNNFTYRIPLMEKVVPMIGFKISNSSNNHTNGNRNVACGAVETTTNEDRSVRIEKVTMDPAVVCQHGINKNSPCLNCDLGKIADPPIQRGVHEARATSPNTFFHVDMTGRKLNSVRRIQYAMLLVDEYSKLGYVMLLHNKTEAGAALKEFRCKYLPPGDVSGIKLLVDQDQSLIAGDFARRASRYGWSLQDAVGYSHYTHGVVERRMRVLDEWTTAAFATAKLSRTYWCFCYAYQSFRYNYTPRAFPGEKDKICPVARHLNKTTVDIPKLPPFGCLAVVKRGVRSKYDFSMKGELAILLGVADTSSFGSYKVLLMGSLKIAIRRAIRFYTNVFPSINDNLQTIQRLLNKVVRTLDVEIERTPMISPDEAGCITAEPNSQGEESCISSPNKFERQESSISKEEVHQNENDQLEISEIEEIEDYNESQPVQYANDGLMDDLQSSDERQDTNSSIIESEVLERDDVQTNFAATDSESDILSDLDSELEVHADLVNSKLEVLADEDLNTSEEMEFIRKEYEKYDSDDEYTHSEMRWAPNRAIRYADVDMSDNEDDSDYIPEDESNKSYLFTNLKAKKQIVYKEYREGKIYSPSPENNPVVIPRSLNQLLKLSERDQSLWTKAICEELTGLFDRKSIEPCSFKDCTSKPLGTKFVFSAPTKEDDAGNLVTRIKARLVILGCQETKPDDEIWSSPIVGNPVLNLITTIGLTNKFEWYSIDISQAFLHAKLEKPRYIVIPDQLDLGSRYFRVVGNLYGLMIAPLTWFTHIRECLLDFGLKSIDTDSCIFWNNDFYIAVYVDDISIHARPGMIEKFYDHLAKWKLPFTKNTSGRFLAMDWKYDAVNGVCRVSQSDYIGKIIKAFGLEKHSKATRIPADPNIALDKCESGEQNNPDYAKLTGKLMYAIKCRPDLAFPVKELAKHMGKNNAIHFEAAKRVVRYLLGTQDLELTLRSAKNGIKLHGFCDASWTGVKGSTKGTTGYIIALGGSLISARSVSQNVVAASSTEAEAIALTELVFDMAHYINILEDLGYPLSEPATIWCDSQPLIQCIMSYTGTRISKGFDRRIQRIRSLAREGYIQIRYINTKVNPSDLLTKNLSQAPLYQHRDQIMNGDLDVE